MDKIDIKILYVEDDASSRLFAATVLKNVTTNLYTAENGLVGLEIFEKYLPEIVITDIAMPQMNGLDMARRIKKIRPDTQILFTTAFDNKETMLQAIDIGVSQYIIKPVRKDNLILALNKVINIIQLEQQVKTQFEYIKTLSNAVEQSVSMILILSPQGEIQYANPAILQESMYDFDELKNNPINILKFDFSDNPSFELLINSIKNCNEWRGEYIARKKTGEPFWVQASLSPIVSSEGVITSFVHVSENITNRKLAQEELKKSRDFLELLVNERTDELIKANEKLLLEIEVRKQTELQLIAAKEQAEAANKAKGLFLAKVSHELRTPMNGILGMTSVLLDSSLDEKQKRSLNIVKYSADSLLRIINDILDFSKIETGKLKLINEPFQFSVSMQHTVDILQNSAAIKGLDLKCIIDQDIPDILIGDSNRLEQTIINLLGNAIKFTEIGFVELRAKLNSETDDGIEILFSVKDSGIGIPDSEADKLFKSFSQIDGTFTRKYGGTGLGLAISKDLVEMMGGKIWLKSKPGFGSAFFFTCLFKKKNDVINSDDEIKENDIKKISKEIYPDLNLNILIAEDSEINNIVIQEALSKVKCRLTFAKTGTEAITYWKNNSFDLILMDIQMPEMNGLEATKIIRESEKENNTYIPIIGVTAHADESDRKKCMDAGMDGYISKPFIWKEFYYEIGKYSGLQGLITEDESLIDLNFLFNSLNNNNDIFNKVTRYFLEHYSDEYNELKKSIDQMDWDKIKANCHKFKSELGNFGAKQAVDLLVQIENLLKNQDIVQIKLILNEFKNSLDNIAQLINNRNNF